MDSFTETIVQGLVQAVVLALVILAGIWGVLKKQFSNGNINGKCEKRLEGCNNKFLIAAEERGDLSTSIKDITGHVKNIEEHMDDRFDILEDKIDGKKKRRK